MNSNLVLIVFIIEFVALAVWAGLEKNWPIMLYGAVLNLGVVWANLK